MQLNSGSTTPVNIDSVGNLTSPSGSATGNLYKSEYVTVANNIYTFINSNSRAPNYASSSLGNIRYEALVYAYARIVNFYRYNGRLPDYVTITNIAGVDSTGVVIDTIAPSVSNNLASGSYNTSKNVTLTATDHVDANPRVYYSLDNGVTWNNQIKTVTLTLNQGITSLKYYGRDATGMILSADQLKPNYIVLLITVNGFHYSVITGITNTTVYLADSSFGNINMTLEDFTAVYRIYIDYNQQFN